MEKERYFKVPESRLLQLLSAEITLLALESGGVDNWSWYGESLNEFFEDTRKDPIYEQVECSADAAAIDIQYYEEIE